MFYDSKTQLINFTDTVTEKVPWTIYRPNRKSKKKYRRVRNELSIKDNIKALKYKSCHSFPACQKKTVDFTDLAHALYWTTNIVKKAANCWNKSFYICQY